MIRGSSVEAAHVARLLWGLTRVQDADPVQRRVLHLLYWLPEDWLPLKRSLLLQYVIDRLRNRNELPSLMIEDYRYAKLEGELKYLDIETGEMVTAPPRPSSAYLCIPLQELSDAQEAPKSNAD